MDGLKERLRRSVQLRLAWRADNDNPALTAVLALTEKVWPAEPA